MSRPRGFTLLEMLVSLVLSTILMGAVLAVVMQLGMPVLRDDVLPETHRGATVLALGLEPVLDGRAVDAWVEMLRRDMEQAATDRERFTNRITIGSVASLDAANRSIIHRPAQVDYVLEDIAGTRWLVRRQRLLDVASNQAIQRDLVCKGVQRFSFSVAMESWDAGRDAAPPAYVPTAEYFADPLGASTSGGPAWPLRSGGESPSSSEDDLLSMFLEDDPIRDHLRLFRSRVHPNWVRESIERASEVRRRAGEVAGTDGPASGVHGVAPADGGKAEERQGREPAQEEAAKSSVWRLRIWTDDGDKPTFDRLVSAQWRRQQ